MTQTLVKLKAIQAQVRFIKMKKPLNLMLIAVFGAFFALAWHKFENGYCVREGRTLRDDELINSALRNVVFSSSSHSTSANDYLSAHPNCCAVERHPATRSIFDVATGFNVAEVEINYEKRENEIKAGMHKFYKSYSYVSACGKFIKNEYGTSTPELENDLK